MTRIVERLVAHPLALDLEFHNEKLVRTRLDWAGGDERPEIRTGSGQAAQEQLEAYVSGRAPVWPGLPYDYSGLSPFALKILYALEKNIHFGQWTTYGQLADMAGHPNSARAVGRVLGANPWPLVIPCHRVMGSGMALTGFSASGGLEMKKYLLKVEGIGWKG